MPWRSRAPRRVSNGYAIGALACFALSVALVTVPRVARADEAPAEPTSEVRALVEEVDRQAAALSIDDCSLACRSLDSMRRTVERLCGLDPGARCERARGKLADAAKRVETACPGCPDTPRVTVTEKQPSPAPPAPAEVASRKGGCAACAIGSSEPDGSDPRGAGAFFATVFLALAFAIRRARRRA